MDYNSIAVTHAHDPAIAALRKDWLPLAVSFLHQAFKQRHQVTVPQDLLQEQLDAYLEHINASLPDKQQHRASADDYINRWSREDDLLRIRVRDEGYIVQLSPPCGTFARLVRGDAKHKHHRHRIPPAQYF